MAKYQERLRLYKNCNPCYSSEVYSRETWVTKRYYLCAWIDIVSHGVPIHDCMGYGIPLPFCATVHHSVLQQQL